MDHVLISLFEYYILSAALISPLTLQLLGYIHQQKNQKGVSEMILRLYNPFLWRALKVANPHVRANAASLLFDAFPLQEPNSTREEIDLGMQKQFDAMMV